MLREWGKKEGDKRKFCQEIPTSWQLDQTWMGPKVQESYNIYPALQFFYRDCQEKVFSSPGASTNCEVTVVRADSISFSPCSNNWDYDNLILRRSNNWGIEMLTSLCWEDQTCSKAFLIKLTDSLVDASSSSLYIGAWLVPTLCKIIFSMWLWPCQHTLHIE